MRPNVLKILVCPGCGAHPLSHESFATGEADEILYGVVWCPACSQWYPIEDGLLELLVEDLAYAEDRARFWATYAARLRALGLRSETPDHNHYDVHAQREQQAHFDWYAGNSQQSYTAYEQTPFWQAEDTLAFETWRQEIRSGGRLLDVGCAQGRSTFKVMDLDLQIVGFDISKSLIRQAIARYRAQKWTATATFFVADAARFPFVDGCFDYILVYGVLHHLPEPATTCREIGRILKTGGLYFGSENNQTIFRTGFDLLQRLRPLWYEEAGAQPLIGKRHFQAWLQLSGVQASFQTSVFLPPHFFNCFSLPSAMRLLNGTDRLFGSIPFLRDQGGLILAQGIKQ